jgi:hypothetical protein
MAPEEMPDLSQLPQYCTAFAEPAAKPLLQCGWMIEFEK